MEIRWIHGYRTARFGSVPWSIGSSGDGDGVGVGVGYMRENSEEILYRSFLLRLLWAIMAWTGTSTLWRCPSSISIADYGVAHSPRCPDGWFWRGCHSVWHARTRQVSVSWQLPEEAPVHPQGSWSYSASSRWSCVPRRKCGEVSTGTWSQKSGSFSQSQQVGSMSHSDRGRWRWQETCTAWTFLRRGGVVLLRQNLFNRRRPARVKKCS